MRVVVYKAVSEDKVAASMTYIALPVLPSKNDPLPVPFFGESAEQAAAYAMQFALDEFGLSGRPQGIPFQ